MAEEQCSNVLKFSVGGALNLQLQLK